MNEFGITSKQVALNLDISPSNLRKWSILLEDEGYKIERNNRNQRIYYERDINTLFQIKTLMEKHRSIDDAIKAVVASVKDNDNAKKALSVIMNERDDNGEQAPKESDFKEFGEKLMEYFVGMEERFEERMSSLRNEVNSTKEMAGLPSPEELERQRAEQLDIQLNISMAKGKLKQEALQEWMEKPESERFKKIGLFRSAEDVSKRDKFVEEYINERLEGELKKSPKTKDFS